MQFGIPLSTLSTSLQNWIVGERGGGGGRRRGGREGERSQYFSIPHLRDCERERGGGGGRPPGDKLQLNTRARQARAGPPPLP